MAGGKGEHLSKGRFSLASPLTVSGQSFCRPRERATCRNSQWALNSHLEIGHWWSDQCHIGCFKYS